MLFMRYEGVRVKGESAERYIMPYIMPERCHAFVFLEQQIDVTNVLSYLERVNRDREKKLTFFHVALCSMLRAMGLRPRMNRFVVGHRIYQRKWIDISFMVKKQMTDDAVMSPAKFRFDKDDTLEDVQRKIDEKISRGRSKKRTFSEIEMEIVAALPRFMILFVIWFLKTLDYFNLLPKSMIDGDELYSSLFVANLGSVGLEAPYHHLYEWGTTPLFGTIGKITKMPVVNERGEVVVRDICVFKWSMDERITDGFYSARSLDLFKQFMLDPSQLERPPQSQASLPPAASMPESAPPVQVKSA